MSEHEYSLFDFSFEDQQNGGQPALAGWFNQEAPIVAPTGRSYAYDVGEELRGARKHLAALTKFTPEWYDMLKSDHKQAFEEISKDNLVGKIIADQLRENGFSSEAAYAIKLVWDRVAQRPEDSHQKREDYVQAINALQEIFAKTISEDLFREAFEKLKVVVKKGYYSGYPLQLEKDKDLINYRYWVSLGDRFVNLFFNWSKKKSGSTELFEKAFKLEEGKDWTWADPKSRSSAAAVKRESNKARWERMVPEEVIRLSQQPSGVSKPDDLLEHYGYRGAQFGNYVNDHSGRYHVLCSGNAHADLADILSIPRQVIGFHGRLGIAYGARGSGAASAHFEPFMSSTSRSIVEVGHFAMNGHMRLTSTCILYLMVLLMVSRLPYPMIPPGWNCLMSFEVLLKNL
ncbi:hypothetical protein [Paenibacillus sp. MMO-58]|uniref:hypothetical protein n=1 Tax=Paenibacillus sp. MMO-58 TaxID=3081290 RepID=UPI0030188F31